MSRASDAPVPARRAYLDWARGIGVLIMIGAHTLDSWTQLADRSRAVYRWAIVLGGIGAPIFLFLAGMSLSMAAGSRRRRGMTDAENAARARRRGWQVFGLAFLFRLQSMLISRGSWASLLKVDILNVMGVSMLGAALLWGAAKRDAVRATYFLTVAIALAMATPLVRELDLLNTLPEPVSLYFRPVPGRTTFVLFPWAGFLLAGAAAGLWLDGARTVSTERRCVLTLGALGVITALGGYLTSFLPPIYARTDFWTSSPTFFFLRLGMVALFVPAGYLWVRLVDAMERRWTWARWSPVQEMGVASLFVYWIHVEMVYGVPSASLHRALPLDRVLMAMMLFAAFLYGLVRLKNSWLSGGRSRKSNRV